MVQVNGKRSGAFAIERLVRRDCPLSPLFYVFALEPLLYGLRNEGANPIFASYLRAKVYGYADDITVFVSRRLDINAVKKAVVRYEEVAGAKINFDKSESRRLDAWRGSVPLT